MTSAIDSMVERKLQILMEIADDFIDQVTEFSARLAKHRKATFVDVKDVALHLGKGNRYKPNQYLI
jgi:transcription initiation factor TFIID subunit TAF12